MNKCVLTIIASLALHNAFSQSTKNGLQCGNSSELTTEQQLNRLNAPINRNDTGAVKCIVSSMNSLSRVHDGRAINPIIEYLDLKKPTDVDESPFGQRGLYGGEYPALTDIVQFGVSALPALIDAIVNSPPRSIKSENAVRALMAIEAPNPPGGIALLMSRAAKENRSRALALRQAAQFAATLPQCRYALEGCQKALGAPEK